MKDITVTTQEEWEAALKVYIENPGTIIRLIGKGPWKLKKSLPPTGVITGDSIHLHKARDVEE